MQIISIFIIGSLYGLYDFYIKLSAGKINPTIGALICQLFSILTIFSLIIYQKCVSSSFELKINFQGILLVATAGILIGLALVSLFFFFQNQNIKVSITFPVITTIRNLVLIILGVLILRENFNLIKAFGLLLCLTGIYLVLG